MNIKKGLHFDETFHPTSSDPQFCAIVAIISQNINGVFEHLDITFINGDLEEEIINGPTFKICDSKEGPLHVLTSKGTLWTKTSITCLVLET